MTLVDDWRKAWKWFSVQGLAFLAVTPILYENFGTLQEYLPANVFHPVMGILAMLALVGRLIKQ